MKISIEKIKELIHRVRSRTESVLRLIVIPGFGGVPLYDVMVYFVRGFTQVNLIDRDRKSVV